ncbi:right-handed parallel beta-helix repeat-containing protein [Haloglomus litoreum]|uniref:right-handed parallel beta-helix repeat-containing protein n=1 Tax=Haloglomus litoreum TaxID=3034026 RepID=UPI0023E83CDA|nr:right-handed parallel beta-helix repeat-containing protein [Haloglomus sp. DT116]
MSRRTHPQLAVSLATVAVLAMVVPFLAVPAGATGTVTVASAPSEYVAPGDSIVLSLDVTDLDELTVDPWAGAPAGTTLVVDGQQANFGTTVTFSPVRTGTVDVVITPPSHTVARDSVVVRDPADGSVFAESGPVSVHPRPLSVPAGDSIQDAVDVAANGTTIQLAIGDYTENVDIGAKTLAIVGAGVGATTVEGLPGASTMRSGEGGITIEDLEVQAPENGAGLYGAFGPVTLRNVSVVPVDPSAPPVYGVNVYRSPLTLQDVSIEGTTSYAVWEVHSSSSTPTTPPVDIDGLTVSDAEVGLGLQDVGTVTLSDLDLSVRTTAITVSDGDAVTLRDSTIVGGTTGIRATDTGTLTVRNSSIVGDNGINGDGLFGFSPVLAMGVADATVADVELRGQSGVRARYGFENNPTAIVVRNATITVVENGTLLGSGRAARAGLQAMGGSVEVYDTTVGHEVVTSGGEPTYGVVVENETRFDARNLTVDGTSYGMATETGSTAVLRESTLSAPDGVRAANESNATLLNVTVLATTGVTVQSGAESYVFSSTVRAPTDANGAPVPGSVTADVGTGAIVAVVLSTLETETGIRFAPDSDPNSYVHSGNDFSATTLAVDNRNPALESDAFASYWGPDGPTADRTAGRVNTDPFLTEPPASVLDEGTFEELLEVQAFAVDLEFPAGSVYAFGTPAPLETNLTETFGDFDGVVYTFDESTQSWTIADGSEVLGPMEAVVVVPTSDARAVVDFEDSTPARATTRSLSPGWNFVAPRYTADAEDALSSDTIAATDLLSVFGEPESLYGDPGDRFIHYQFVEETGSAGSCDFYCEEPATTTSPRISAFGGYFVYVTEPGTIPGVVPSGVGLEDFLRLLPAAEDET